MNGFLTGLVRPVAPSTFARRGRPASARRVVVCAGDSLTHGLISANWVSLLDAALARSGTVFVNAGISGDLAWNLGERLDEVIACRPDVVTVLIGTNDALAQIDDSWRDGYLKDQHLPQRPTLDWYREQLRTVVTRLQQETRAAVVLLTIPPIGEDLDSRYNTGLVAEVNGIIRQVGEEAAVEVLPLHDRLVAALPADRIPPRFDGTKRLMGRSALHRLLFRRRYDRISADVGRLLFIDDIHLNERAARMVAHLVEERLQGHSTSEAPR